MNDTSKTAKIIKKRYHSTVFSCIIADLSYFILLLPLVNALGNALNQNTVTIHRGP